MKILIILISVLVYGWILKKSFQLGRFYGYCESLIAYQKMSEDEAFQQTCKDFFS